LRRSEQRVQESRRRALSISQGDPFTLVSTPISATLLSISVLVLVLPAILRWFLPKIAPA
jgi:putative tricarboxylic transport membrane protein